MNGWPDTANETESTTLALRILLAVLDRDDEQATRLINEDIGAAVYALTTTALAMAASVYGDLATARENLALLAMDADLDQHTATTTGPDTEATNGRTST